MKRVDREFFRRVSRECQACRLELSQLPSEALRPLEATTALAAELARQQVGSNIIDVTLYMCFPEARTSLHTLGELP